jgi:hypothetical protein
MTRKLKGGAIVDSSVTGTQIETTLVNKITNAYNQANAAYGQANTGSTSGADAYNQANAAYGQANNARSDANTTFATINTTFGTVNTSLGTVNTSLGTINTNYQAAYAQANTARTTANDAYAAANTKVNATGGSITGDLSITGNLTVQGNATTINVSNLSVNDSIMLLASGGTGDSLDIGFVGHIQRDAVDTHVGLIRKAVENQFYLFDNYEVEPTNNIINVSGNNFRLANLKLGIANANTFVTSAGLDVTGQANAAYGQANAAYGAANNRVLKAGDTMTGNLTMTGTQPSIRLQESGSGGDKRLQLSVNSAGVAFVSADQSSQELAFTTVGSERIRITSGGNVGIATTNPTQKLHVVGAVQADDFRSAISSQVFYLTGDEFKFRTSGGTDRVQIDSSGNLFVNAFSGRGGGSTGYIFKLNPGKVYFELMANNTTMQSDILFTDGTSGAYGIVGYNHSNDSLRIYTNSAERLTINSSGNIGVGTTDPSQRLHVESNTSDANGFRVQNQNNGAYISISPMGTNGYGITGWANSAVIESVPASGGGLVLSAYTGSVIIQTNGRSERVRIDSSGNVGIGTNNPQGKLTISNAGAEGIEFFATGGVGGGPYFNAYNRSAGRYIPFTYYANTHTFYTNTGSTRALDISTGGSVGIGTNSPNYRAHIQHDGITAAAISTGWPAYNAENATQSKTILFLSAGNNGSVATAGQGGSAVLMLGDYFDSRGIITMQGAGGSSPSDVATGYGKDLMVKAGNSDNGNGYVGGRLLLAGGSGYSGGAYGSNYGAVVLQPQGGGVGIGTTNPGSSTKLYVNGQSTLKRLQKQVYNWYTTSGSSYVHFKTTLKLTGTGYHVGMWSWRFYGYSYGTARIIDSYFGMHSDGSGNIYSAAYQDQGEFAFCTNMYKSSDNFLVIVGVIDSTYFFCLDVDIQHVADYSYMELGISAVSQSASTSGVY